MAITVVAGLRYDAEHHTIKLSADSQGDKVNNRALLIRATRAAAACCAAFALSAAHCAPEQLRDLMNEAFVADSNYIPPLSNRSVG